MKDKISHALDLMGDEKICNSFDVQFENHGGPKFSDDELTKLRFLCVGFKLEEERLVYLDFVLSDATVSLYEQVHEDGGRSLYVAWQLLRSDTTTLISGKELVILTRPEIVTNANSLVTFRVYTK